MTLTRPQNILLTAVLAALFVSLSGPALAQDGSCASPRAAVATFLDNLQPDVNRPEVAIQCFDFSQGPTKEAMKHQVARDLKSVLDGRGLYVDYATVPAEADYVDPTTGLSRAVLFSTMPDLYLEKNNGQWLMSSLTVQRTGILMEQTFLLPLQRIAQRMPSWLQGSVLGVPTWKLIGLALLIVLALVVARVLEYLVHVLFKKVVARWFEDWDESFEQAIVRRMSWMVAAGLVALLLPNLGLPVMLARFLLLVLKGFASICAVLIATATVDLLADAMQRRADQTDTRMDDQLVPLLRRSAKMLTWVVGLLFVLQNLHVDVSSLLGSLAIGGLAFSLAAKDTVANVFGSFTIFTDRPFQIGDFVSIGGTDGTVEEVGFRSTRLRTSYDSVITLPNSKVANATIDNLGQRRFRRFKATLGLTYDATPEQIETFVAGVRSSLDEHPMVGEAYEVHFNAMNASSLDVMVHCFFASTAWADELKGRQELMITWMRLAKEVGVDFAFPTQTLHLEGLVAAQA